MSSEYQKTWSEVAVPGRKARAAASHSSPLFGYLRSWVLGFGVWGLGFRVWGTCVARKSAYE